MRALAWLPLACLLVCGGCASTSSWDPFAATPEPMELPDGLDARDPYAFYAYGQQILESSPARAAEAFYWAARLDPSWASPLFARRMALLLANPEIFDLYSRGNRRVLTSPGVRQLDSLYLRALTMNPFPERREDAPAVRSLIVHRVRKQLMRSGSGIVDDAAVRFVIDDYLRQGDPATRAWIAYSEGRYGDAATHYRKAVERHDDDPQLRADLARTLFRLGQYADAAEEMAAAVELLSEREDEELVRVYESKALYEHSIGLIREAVANQDGARDSYARALQEDLAYYPAHMRLAELALAARDTATALAEMALAVEIRPDDAGVRYRNGVLLSTAGRHDEAEAELRAAIELEPLFAAPYRALALALEAQGRAEDAAREHARFLEKAHPRAPGVDDSRARLGDDAPGGA